MGRRRVLLVVAALVGAVTAGAGIPAGPLGGLDAAQPAGAAVSKVAEPVSSFGSLTVDSTRLFVSAPNDATVLVTDLAGVVQHTITGESGAIQVALDGASLLVLRRVPGGGGSLDVLDATTFAVDGHLAFASTFVPSDVAVVGGHAWVGGATTGGGPVLDDVDVSGATQTMQSVTGLASCDVLAAHPQVTGQLICASSNTATPLAEIDTTGPQPVVGAEMLVAGGTRDVAVTPSGSILLAAGNTGDVLELAGSDLHTLSTFAVSRFSYAPAHELAVTATGGGRFVAGGSIPGLQEFALSRPGGPVGAEVPTWNTRPRGLRYSLDGNTVYRVGFYPNNGVVLEIYSGISPITIPPTPVFTHVPAKVSSDGAGFTWDIGGWGIPLCSYDHAAYQACGSPHTIPSPTVGNHTFSVLTERAVGADSPVISYTWREAGYLLIELYGNFPPETAHVGERGAIETALVENLTDEPVSFSSITLTGADPFDFDGATDCGRVLAPNLDCHIQFWVRPLQPGTATASITVTSDAADSPKSLPISATGTEGYYVADSNGSVAYGGDARFYGDLSGRPLASSIIDMAVVPPGTKGYWLLGRDGGIFTFGGARFFGSTGAIRLNRPVVAMAPTPSGNGYWLVASDGGIFAFGDAKFYGSTGGIRLNRPIVGIAPTRTGHGYWLVASDGGIFAFGDAKFFGSTGAIRLAQPIIAMSVSPTGRGYWFVASDGGVFAYGDAEFGGSLASRVLTAPVIDFEATPTGFGYWMLQRDGTVWGFGDAGLYGSALGDPAPIVAFASDVTSLPIPGPSRRSSSSSATTSMSRLGHAHDVTSAAVSRSARRARTRGTTSVP